MTRLRPVLARFNLRTNLIPFVLLLITAVGGCLRFYNLNWDEELSFHPDERNIAAAVTRISFFDSVNPQFFAYGGFLIYVYRAACELVYKVTSDPSWISSWGKINLVGRSFSAIFSTLTIPAIYFLSKKLFNNKGISIFSSFISAFTVAFIQTAHFGVTESLLVLLVVLLCIISLQMIKNPHPKFYILAGIVYGVAVATKISALSFIFLPFVAHLIVVFSKPTSLQLFIRKNLLFLALVFTSGLVFILFSSYVIFNWQKFMESMRYEFGVATGRFSVPYTLQFTGTWPYLFQFKNLFWQLGPYVLFSLAGFVLMFVILFRRINSKILLFLAFPVCYFLYVGSWHTKFIRFMTPVLPFLVIAGSYCLFLIRKKIRWLGNLFLILTAITTILWAFSFFSIYTREQTRISASKWIYRNIIPGRKILGEHWDDGLPVSLPNFTPNFYDIEQLTVYEPDNEKKVNYYARKLAYADYVIINSRRLYGTLIHLEDKYPITSRYYKFLFAEELGYERVAEFTSYPCLFGIEINDDNSEETFQVYDHPKVMIFAKKTPMTEDRLAELIGAERFINH
jgi:4-amino-4-deoxy-L-arabinose transferase-like glycosyltransferase